MDLLKLTDFFRSRKNIILFSLALLLIISIIACTCTVVSKNKTIKQLNTTISQNNKELEKINKEVSRLQGEIKASTDNNNQLKSQLDEANSQKNSLQAENEKLKKTIEQLSNKHQQNTIPIVSTPYGEPNSKLCYLTFDDGPSDNTLKILDILRRYNAKATFFVINTRKIDYIKDIHSQGHVVALHSYTHEYENIYSSADAYFADLNAISSTVEGIIGIKSNLIRFPGGSSNAINKNGLMNTLINSVKEKGYYYFDWNVDSGDALAKNVSYTKIVNNVLTAAKSKNSICVLMHDTQDKTSTVTALPYILEGLKNLGYRFEGLTPESKGYRHRG